MFVLSFTYIFIQQLALMDTEAELSRPYGSRIKQALWAHILDNEVLKDTTVGAMHSFLQTENAVILSADLVENKLPLTEVRIHGYFDFWIWNMGNTIFIFASS